MGRSGPPSNTYGLLGPPESTPKRHLDRFSRCYRAYERDQQTDGHTDTHIDHTTSPVAMRPNNDDDDDDDDNDDKTLMHAVE